MNKRLSLKIARRVNVVLGETLGEGIDPQRMLTDALYARDVLLVCKAMPERELRKLARMFRQAMLEPEPTPGAVLVRETKSISSVLNSIFGHHAEPGPAAPADAKPARRWFGLVERSAPASK